MTAFITKKHLPRRTFLRGMGVTLALPLLDSMVPAQTPLAKTAAMPKTDINSASKEDLMKLPGVGDATADKIIAARPFKMKSQLVSKGIVTKAEYAKLAAHVVAKSEAKK